MNKPLQNIRIARVSTIPFFVFTQLRSQLETLAMSGAKVTVVASDDDLTNTLQLIKNCTFKPVYIARQINFFADLLTVMKLWKLFRKERYHIIHSTTPKAGLLCAIAAKLAGTPVCIHTYTGQAWITMSGMKKRLVRFCDKIIASLNCYSYTDSNSQRTFLIENNIVKAEKLKVIGSGSLAGVNTQRFCQDNYSELEKTQLKNSLKIDSNSKILLFVGRVTKEKGIFELIDAVEQMLLKGHELTLIVVGPFDQNNEQEMRQYAEQRCGNKIIFTGFHAEPEQFMAITDLLCLPSYREGFGTVVIEAGAMGIPVLGTNIYGLSDAVIDGVTGVLAEPKNTEQLTHALEQLLADDSLRVYMGQQAKARAIKEFDSDYCSALLVEEYKRLLDIYTSNFK